MARRSRDDKTDKKLYDARCELKSDLHARRTLYLQRAYSWTYGRHGSNGLLYNKELIKLMRMLQGRE